MRSAVADNACVLLEVEVRPLVLQISLRNAVWRTATTRAPTTTSSPPQRRPATAGSSRNELTERGLDGVADTANQVGTP